jgi:hypothetical protein
VFLDDRSRQFFDDWDAAAQDTAGLTLLLATADPGSATEDALGLLARNAGQPPTVDPG